MAESEEELKSLLMKGKEESEKVGLILNIQKTNITASGPITPWQKHGETMETGTNFTLFGSKVTVDGDCCHEIKRCLLIVRKALNDLDSMLKSRDITLLTKVHLLKAMVFSSSHVWMWELGYKQSWAPKIDAFELWCWRRLLRVPWTGRRSNQSILKEISPEYSMKGLMLKLKLQYFGHLMRRADSFKKTLILGKIESRRKKGMTEDNMVGWHHWLNGHEFEKALGVGDGQGTLLYCSPWHRKESDTTEHLNWTEDKHSHNEWMHVEYQKIKRSYMKEQM